MTNVDTFRRVSAAVLGWGSIAFAGWALAKPDQFARFMGTDPANARLTGVRDLVIGWALIGRADRWAFAARASADAWDAATVAKPDIARGAACFGLWAATAALWPGESRRA